MYAAADEASLAAAFLMGVLGSGHCVAMCGGIACALTVGLEDRVRRSPARMLPYVLAYNTGRIVSYSLAGLLVGLAGAQAANLLPPAWVRQAGVVVSAAFIIALGLYLADWWRGLAALERVGTRLWRHLEPLGRRALPVTRVSGALGAGLVWGWLPCGLVYAALSLALVRASPTGGALTMLAFGLGTLPTLLVLGFAGRWITGLARRPQVRRAAGIGLCVLGVAALALGLAGGHDHHTARAEETSGTTAFDVLEQRAEVLVQHRPEDRIGARLHAGLDSRPVLGLEHPLRARESLRILDPHVAAQE